MRRRTLLTAAAASLAAPLFGTGLHGRALAQGRGPIVLGQSAAFSGPASELGEQFNSGAALLLAAVNARGGINGRPIDLVSLDDGYEPDRCAANTRQFIEQGVLALFGYVGTPTSLAALPLATAARLPFIAPFTGAEALRAPFNRYAFHVRASYYDETAAIVRQLQVLGPQRVGVFYQNDSYGRAGLDGVLRALRPLNQVPASLGTVERNSVEVAAAVPTILAGQPTAVVMISAYKSCAAFIRAARAAGYGGSFYNVSFVGTQALAQELGPDARGVVVSQVMPYPFSAATAISGEYLAAGRAALGSAFAPTYSSIEGYVAARVLLEALRRPGAAAGGEALVGALEGLRDLDLGGFSVDFSPVKRTGSRFVELTLLTADGKVRR